MRPSLSPARADQSPASPAPQPAQQVLLHALPIVEEDCERVQPPRSGSSLRPAFNRHVPDRRLFE